MILNKAKIQEVLTAVDLQQAKIRGRLADKPDLAGTLQEKLRVEWTYNSNAIEGNTLSLGETMFFLREGLTSEGRPLKDYLEAKNHAEAIDGLYEIIMRKRQLTESAIKELHGVLMRNIDFTFARGAGGKLIQKPLNAGRYKIRPNHVLTVSGKIHHYTNPLKVHDEMEALVKWLHGNSKMHVVEKAAIFHYRFVKIHPFDDGNGRMARLLMNLILMQARYYPCIIRNEKRKIYLERLEEADETGDSAKFVMFVMSEFLDSLERMAVTIGDGPGWRLAEQTMSGWEVLKPFQREEKILGAFETGKYLSIGDLLRKFPEFARPTLKMDLKRLVRTKKIAKKGQGKATIYSKKS